MCLNDEEMHLSLRKLIDNFTLTSFVILIIMFYKNYLELIVFKYEPASFENQIYFQIEF